MTGLDWLIVVFVVVLAAQGYRRGFIVGVLGFIGFAAGAILGTRLGPQLLPAGTDSVWAPAFGLVGALIAGGILATGLEGIGFRLRRGLVLPGLGVVDGALGALLSAAIALGVVWIAAAVAAQAPGDIKLRGDLQQSFIVRELNQLLPPSSGVLNALAALDPLPAIAGPTPDVPPPSPAIAHSAAVRGAQTSVVRIVGDACGLGVEGSGWVAEPGIVVTNAHVVAGEHDTTVQVGGDPANNLPAQAVAFDPHNDIALLSVPGLRAAPLPLAEDPPSGRSGAILGYPRDGPFDARAARIGATQTVLTQDAYGSGPVSRRVTPLRGLVRPGNSGGPVVDATGHVLTTVFASTTGSGPHGGYGVANSIVSRLLAGPHTPVSTQSCAG
jgi:S1-C subfamily serine protease